MFLDRLKCETDQPFARTTPRLLPCVRFRGAAAEALALVQQFAPAEQCPDVPLGDALRLDQVYSTIGRAQDVLL